MAALAEIACDPAEPDDTLVALCAESIAGIWIERGAVDGELPALLTPWARREAEGLPAAKAPELLVQ